MMSEAEQLSCVMKELAEIKKILSEVLSEKRSPDKEFLTVDEAAEIMGVSRSHIYRLTSEKRIPFSKPGGKRVMIRRRDFIEWLETNRVKSQNEVQKDIEEFMKNSRRPGRKSPKR